MSHASPSRLPGIQSTDVEAARVKFALGRADEPHMGHQREPRSSRRRFLGTLIGAACACRLAVEAAPRALAEGSIVRLDEPGTALQTAERLALRPSPVPDGMLMFPVAVASDCYILDNFGDARGSRLHEGVDIMGSAGREVLAVASGVLTKRYTNTGTAGWGWTLYDESTDTTYKYFHLTDDPAGLLEGDAVTIGQPLGHVGSSGTNSPDNIHLHFEVRPRNVAIDPLPLLVVDRGVCGVSRPYRARSGSTIA
jgi:murein DD-endopeptidase MepM/ murein hydrolase activator NlpD